MGFESNTAGHAEPKLHSAPTSRMRKEDSSKKTRKIPRSPLKENQSTQTRAGLHLHPGAVPLSWYFCMKPEGYSKNPPSRDAGAAPARAE